MLIFYTLTALRSAKNISTGKYRMCRTGFFCYIKYKDGKEIAEDFAKVKSESEDMIWH